MGMIDVSATRENLHRWMQTPEFKKQVRLEGFAIKRTVLVALVVGVWILDEPAGVSTWTGTAAVIGAAWLLSGREHAHGH